MYEYDSYCYICKKPPKDKYIMMSVCGKVYDEEDDDRFIIICQECFCADASEIYTEKLFPPPKSGIIYDESSGFKNTIKMKINKIGDIK